ncbi:MAG: Ig-like domain-containing protein [Candidatus Delongbacteria bacterium]|nr:Ig-like domain-containing protein [Candidatus Delongbacteria bacterium]
MLKRINLVLLVVMSFVLIMSCSDDDTSTSPTGDTTAPTVTVSNLVENQNILGSYTVQVSADDSDLYSVSLYIDGSLYETTEAKTSKGVFYFNVNFGDLTSGNHIVYAKATDGSSNTAQTGSITINNSDSAAPTVTIANLTNGQNVSGIFTINVDATDNTSINRVTLYIDGSSVETIYAKDTKGIYYFDVNFNSYSDGSRSVYAIAYDGSNNSETSNAISINSEYDFALYGNGVIRVSIDHYQELDPLDLTGYGDPYFEFNLYIDDVLYSQHFTSTSYDTQEINTPIYYDFDIPDKTRQVKISIKVWDEDGASDDIVDYCNEAGNYYIWTLSTLPNGNLLNYSNTYSGADDGQGDDDCEITMSVKALAQ